MSETIDIFDQLLTLKEVTHIALSLANGYNQCKSLNDQINLIVSTINSLGKSEKCLIQMC